MNDNPKQLAAKGKPRWCLLPWDLLCEVVMVFTRGAEKYSDHGWKTIPNAREEYFSAAMRHLTDFYGKGLRADSEFGTHPLAHAIADILIIWWHDLHTCRDCGTAPAGKPHVCVRFAEPVKIVNIIRTGRKPAKKDDDAGSPARNWPAH